MNKNKIKSLVGLGDVISEFLLSYVIIVLITNIFLVTDEHELRSWVKPDYIFIATALLFIVIRIFLSRWRKHMFEMIEKKTEEEY